MRTKRILFLSQNNLKFIKSPRTGQDNGKSFCKKELAVKKKNSTDKEKSSTLKRLVIANAIATLALVTISITVLWALGLLGSIFAFFF